jgi:hypothetical protein
MATSYNDVLGRLSIVQQVKEFLDSFARNAEDLQNKRAMYIYGASGSGKTHFITDLLTQLNYDVIRFDAANNRNKGLIESLTSNHVSTYNVVSLMQGKKKKLAILMDEIDGMNSGDKGGINALIKLIRQKKTKKQKDEQFSKIPIMAIGNYMVDKKIGELMRVCSLVEIAKPTVVQMHELVRRYIPSLAHHDEKSRLIEFMQGDLRKFHFIQKLLLRNPQLLLPEKRPAFHRLLRLKTTNDSAKQCVLQLFNHRVAFGDHHQTILETDRTTVALLWHENIIDRLDIVPQTADRLRFYLSLLRNICFADYMDRLTFQHQIWFFNEMTSLLKTMKNNAMYHDAIQLYKKELRPLEDVRFTKVLTKYSTEYNNSTFLFFMCQELHMDRKDVIGYFQELRHRFGEVYYENNDILLQIHQKFFSSTEIKHLDIKRIYRYLDKSSKKTTGALHDGALDE